MKVIRSSVLINRIQNFNNVLEISDMSMKLKSVKRKWAVLRSLPFSLFFNFYYLSFKQAIRLPILLYKPRFYALSGQVQIEGKLSYGMIRLGFMSVPLYPNAGIVWENKGGTVIFKGRCGIGNNSSLSIGNNAVLEIGHDFSASSTLRLVCNHSVVMEQAVHIGWECLIMDTSFHRLKNREGGYYNKGFAPVKIGENNWISTRCIILQGTRTPSYCTFAAGSILRKNYEHYPSYSLFAGHPLEVKAEGVWRDMEDLEIV